MRIVINIENISKEHYINNIKPDYLVSLPFVKDEQINETNVTCFFCVETLPMKLKCIGIEFFDIVDNKLLETIKFSEIYPTHIYIFKNATFDLDKERERLILD